MHESLKSMLAAAEPVANAHIPLVPAEEKRAPYPVEALPQIIKDAVVSYQDYGQQPIEMIAMSALANMSLACQGLAHVARDSQLIGPISANSGERKSSGDQVFAAAAREWQREKLEEMRDRIKLAQAAVMSFEAQRSGLLSQITALTKKGRMGLVPDIKTQLEALELNAPIMPMQPHLFYEDTTQEALIEGLATRWPSAAIASDEAGIVIGGHSFREEKAMQFFASLNRLWDGNDYKHNRVTVDSHNFQGRRLSYYLMMQTSVLRQLLKLGDGQGRGIGFLARILFAAPESTMGTRRYKPPSLHYPYVDAFSGRIRQLLSIPLPVKEGTLQLELPTLSLSAPAHARWVEYYNEVETQLGKFGDYETVKDFASKSAENAARLAGNFHVFTYGQQGEIDADTMQRGIAVARWHLYETRRIFMQMEQPDDVLLAQALLEWIEERGQASITLTEMLQYGPYKLRNRNNRDIALRKLIEHGYLTEVTEGKRIIYQSCKRN